MVLALRLSTRWESLAPLEFLKKKFGNFAAKFGNTLCRLSLARCPGVTVKPHDSLSLRNHSQMLHRTRLRNRGGKGEFITVIIVNDHYGFAFDFHFIRRDPASAGKRGEYNFANLFKDALKASATFGLKMESRSS